MGRSTRAQCSKKIMFDLMFFVKVFFVSSNSNILGKSVFAMSFDLRILVLEVLIRIPHLTKNLVSTDDNGTDI